MTLTQIKPLGLSKPVDLADNEKIRLGTGQDLEIFFDGTHSRIKHTPATGDLVIQSDDLYVTNAAGNEYYIRGVKDGSVDLYHDNTVKIQTANVGAIIKDGDYNVTLRFETTTGQAGNITGIDDDNLIIQDNTGKEWLNMHKDGQVEIYHNGIKKFETTALGATLSGELSATGANFTDDGQSSPIVSIMADDGSPWGLVLGNSTFGNNLGLHAYCNNTGHVYIDNIGSGSTFPNWDMRLSHASAAHSMIQFDGPTTGVKIYYGGYEKLRTAAYGTIVTGDASTVQEYFKTNDGVVRGYIYADSNNHIYILDGQAHKVLKGIKDGATQLYYDNTLKLGTQPSGIDVLGSSSSDAQVRLKDNSGNILGYLYAGSGNSVWLLDNQAHGIIKGVANGEVHLFYDNVETLATEMDGIRVTDNNSSVHIKMVTSDGDAGYVYGSSNSQMGFLDREGHWMMRGTKDGSAELMYDNTTRFQTYNNPAGTYVTGRAHVQCENDSVCQHNMTTHSSGAYHQENLGNSGAIIAYVGHSSHLCASPTVGNYAIRFEGDGLEFANSSAIKARITNHGGIAFGGDTAAANTLGDYEEGQWTPTVNYGVVTSGSNALSYSIQQGWYVRIGGFVQASFYISFTAKGDGNDFTMGGLPFASVNKPYNDLSYSSSGSLGYKDCNFTNNADQKLYVGNNAANIYFYNNDAGTHSPAATRLVSTAHIASALYGSVSYRAE